MDDANGAQATIDELAAEVLARYEELNLLYGLSAELSGTLDVHRLCDFALQRAFAVLGASHGGIVLTDADAEGIRLWAVHTGSPLAVGDLLPPGASIAEQVTRSGEVVVRHAAEPDPIPTVVRQPGQPGLAVPLLAAQAGQPPLGAISLLRPVGARNFTSGDIRLAQAIASQLAARIAVSRLTYDLLAAEDMRRELHLASAVQRALLPALPDEVAGLQVAARSVSAASIGGDLYDVVESAGGIVWLVVADVAGHGVGSALLMAGVRAVLRAQMASALGPAAVLRAANELLYDELLRAEHLVTALCVRWDPASRVLAVASGGHNPALLRRTDGSIDVLDPDGLPLGLLPAADYVELKTTLSRNELLLLHSDGVVEARDRGSVPFGDDALHALLAAAAGPAALIGAVEQAVAAHLGGRHAADDVTLLAVTPTATPPSPIEAGHRAPDARGHV